MSDKGSIIFLKIKKITPWNERVISKIKISRKLKIKNVDTIIIRKKLGEATLYKTFKYLLLIEL